MWRVISIVVSFERIIIIYMLACVGETLPLLRTGVIVVCRSGGLICVAVWLYMHAAAAQILNAAAAAKHVISCGCCRYWFACIGYRLHD